MNSISDLNLLTQMQQLQNGRSQIPSFMANEYPSVIFKCSECPMVKSSCEDLEIHIKIEHLNWLPFACVFCTAKRASDNQIREHVISHHQKNEYRYSYVDNPQAKRILQGMIDRSLSNAVQQMVAKKVAMLQTSRMSPPSNGSGQNLAKRKRLHDIISQHMNDNVDVDESSSSSISPVESTASATVTIDPKKTEPLTLTSDYQDPPNLSDDVNNQLSAIFGNNQNQDDDYDESDVSSSLLKTLEKTSSHDDVDTDQLIQNVSNLFQVNFDELGLTTPKPAASQTKQIRRRPGTSAQCFSVSKKRVLGECNKCNKPVTAGARQMHMFYHLGKDENTYRFKCRFEDCDVEHYRKDQMENHMSKQHGRIDHDMMIDRSTELYARVQKLSLELLGTVGNTPGPTAARAQATYNRMQKEQELKKSAKNGEEIQDTTLELIQAAASPSSEFSNGIKPVRPGNEENLECKLCHKFIVNRTRGFHILWHLCNDLGIIRYTCKLCDYKHERPQSVQTHGRKEHGREDVMIDSLPKYEEEVKSMSKACFGLEQLFSKESRRKSKLPTTSSVEELSEDEVKPHTHEASFNSFSPNKSLNSSTQSQAKKRTLSRRFGTRRPKSKKQRQEMVKLREISMRIGGASYIKKKLSEQVYCEECGKYVTTRLTSHAYSHLNERELFMCPKCDMGHNCRQLVQKHLKDLHNSTMNPTDNRMKFAQEIKDTIKRCFPAVFVDAPIPNADEVEKLKKSLNLSDGSVEEGEEQEENDESQEQNDENEDEDAPKLESFEDEVEVITV